MNGTIKRSIACLILLLTAAAVAAADEEPARVVGRVYYLEGELSRYVPDENNWVDMVRDAPFAAGDTLFSGDRSMTELIVPNGTWIRTGHETQIQFITLDAEVTEADLGRGTARFYNKSPGTTVKATTAFGYVMADPDTAFDIYADSDSVEVIAVKGSVRFIHQTAEARYEVLAGSTSIIANQDSVSTGEGAPEASWDRWNESRESFWASRTRGERRSARYLPPSLHDESYVLEEYGQWERVPYEGSPRWFWRPTRVAVGWSPFTVGRWTEWCGDQTWIPAEPFGYVTHHYGNWIYMRNGWFWAPPVVSVQIGVPLLDIGYYWYPGRVSWIHRDAHVGWVPLAPREIYCSHYNWGGPYSVVYGGVGFSAGFGVSIGSYAFARHAVVVPRDRFYGVVNYRSVRVTNIHSTTIINNYRIAPVIDGSVIHNYSSIKERHFYGNKGFRGHPSPAVGIDRIRHNDMVIQRGGRERPGVLKERIRGMQEGRVHSDIRLKSPKTQFFERTGPLRGKDTRLEMRAPREIRMRPGHGGGNIQRNPEIREKPDKGQGGHKGQLIQEGNRQGAIEMRQNRHEGQMRVPGDHGNRSMRAPAENRVQPMSPGNPQRNPEVRGKSDKGQMRVPGDHGNRSMRAPAENRVQPMSPGNPQRNPEVRGKSDKGQGGHKGQVIQGGNRQGAIEMRQNRHEGQMRVPGDHGNRSMRAPAENRVQPMNPGNPQRNPEVRGKSDKGQGGHKGQVLQGNRQGGAEWPQNFEKGHGGQGNHGR